MGYFRELPNLKYISPLPDRGSSLDYVEAKNLFKRVRVRQDFESVFTAFNKYTIQENIRPDQVAQELYGSPELDWVVLLSAGIVNVRDQWPLSNKDLVNYVERLYGTEIDSPRYYVTKEVKDSKGRIIIPEGKIVEKNYKLPKPTTDNQPLQSYVRYYDSQSQTYVTVFNITKPVTNYEYEIEKNDAKRQIYVLKRGYLQEFLNDTRTIMKYKKSSQYVNDYLIQGENLRITSP